MTSGLSLDCGGRRIGVEAVGAAVLFPTLQRGAILAALAKIMMSAIVVTKVD